jgi:hypothetical protein
LKLTAALLPPLALRKPGRRPQLARLLAWIAAGILTIYGAVLTTVGLLVQADVIHRSQTPTGEPGPGMPTPGTPGCSLGEP